VKNGRSLGGQKIEIKKRGEDPGLRISKGG